MKRIFKKAVILPLILGGALLLILIAILSRSEIEYEELQYPTRMVEVITANNLPFQARVTAYGHVEPSILLKARAEISGKISYIHPDLKKGASLAKDTVVLRIEPTIFEFSLDQSKAGLSSSQSSLKQLEVEEKSTRRSWDIARKNLEIGQKELARFRILWDKRVITRSTLDDEQQKVLQLSQQMTELEGKLASYKSRKAVLQAQINKSRTQLAQSQDTLGRTEISLPFDARIGTVSVEKGEFVATSSQLFEALGTQAVEINAQLPVKQFSALISGLGEQALNLQNPEDLQRGFTQMRLGATVRLVSNEQEAAQWQGDFLRIGESIDPTRNTVSLVISVNNPYENIIPGKRPPLLKGMYVAVELYAPVRDMIVLPRKALHQGRVYVAMPEGRLEIRPVTILMQQGPLVVIEDGLTAGEKIIITDVIPVINGLPLTPVLAQDVERQLARDALGNRAGDIGGYSGGQEK